MDRLTDILHDNGYGNVTRFVPACKDWNEDLKQRNGIEALPAVPHKRKELYWKTVDAAVLIPLRTGELPQMLVERLNGYDYNGVANAALTAAVRLLKIGKNAHDTDLQVLGVLKERLKKEYKPYTDKSRAAVKLDELQKQVRNVVEDLKGVDTRTETQIRELAKKLYGVADCAIRCRTEEKLKEMNRTAPVNEG